MAKTYLEWADWAWGGSPPSKPHKPAFVKLKQPMFQRIKFRGGYYKYTPATGVLLAEVISWISENIPNVLVIHDDLLDTIRIKFKNAEEVMAFKLVWVY